MTPPSMAGQQMGMGGDPYAQQLMSFMQANPQNPELQQALMMQYLNYMNPANQLQLQAAQQEMMQPTYNPYANLFGTPMTNQGMPQTTVNEPQMEVSDADYAAFLAAQQGQPGAAQNVGGFLAGASLPGMAYNLYTGGKNIRDTLGQVAEQYPAISTPNLAGKIASKFSSLF